MNLIQSWAIGIITLLFYESIPISSTEVWIYRVAISIFLLFLILFIIGKNLSPTKKKNMHSKEKTPNNVDNRISQSSLDRNVTGLSNRIKILEEKVKYLQQEKFNYRPVRDNKPDSHTAQQLREERKKIRNSVSEVYDDRPSPEIELPVTRITDNSNIDKKEIFYLTSPDKDKAFYAPEATLEPGEKTLYSVEDGILKLYENVNEQTMRLALNSLDIFVKRVCDILNARESHHSKIVMVEPGSITKEKDDFLVINKIKVKFA